MRRLARTVDRAQRRRPVLGVPVAVAYKYADDAGGHLAALLTYYGLVSVFPLLLLASTVLGRVLSGHPELQGRIIGSALDQLPVIGGQLTRPAELGGGALGIVVGLVGAAYGGAGVARALQNASDTAWAVPRHQRPNPFVGRIRGLRLVAAIAVDLVGSAAVAAAGRAVARSGAAGALLDVLAVALTWLLHAVVFGYLFAASTSVRVPVRDVLPGAAVAAGAWTALQHGGSSFVRSVLGTGATTNDVLAVALGLLALLYVQSVALIVCIELNTVLARRLFPRSLLHPFTSQVTLTGADRRTWTGIAQAQQLQDTQVIKVDFPPSER